MKCPNCGKNIDYDSLYCEYCGVKINLVSGNNTTHKKHNLLWIFLILVLCFFLLLLWGTLWHGGNGSCSRGDNTSFNGMGYQSSHDMDIDGLELDFYMSLEDIKRENKGVSIVKYSVPKNYEEDDDVVVVSCEGFDYYIVNNNTAITLKNGGNTIGGVTTKQPRYRNAKGIGVGSTWGDIEQLYSNLDYCVDWVYYNYFSHQYEAAIEIIDSATCTYFVFSESQFSPSIWESIISVAGGSDYCSGFNVSELPYTVHESIKTSIKVSQICTYYCNMSN